MANVLTIILRAVLLIVDALVGIVLKFIFDRQRRSLPAIRNPLLLKSATELATLIRTRKVRCRQVVNAFVERIKETNPLTNAVVAERFEDALREADRIDDVLDGSKEGSLPDEYSEDLAPLLGVPFTAKEAFAISGLANTSGLVSRKHVKATRDADVVALLRQAGAIPIGLTNVSELCMWHESFNEVYGRTNNVYHLGRTVGGSSGGEGCVLAAAGSVVGVGSDVGGSIRMPALFSGVFGHKPTTGIVSNSGQHPGAAGLECNYLSTGPLYRYACDLVPMLKVMAGPEGRGRLSLDKPVDLRKVTFYYMEDDGGRSLCSPVHADIREAVRRVINHASTKLQARVKNVYLHLFSQSFDIWQSKRYTSGSHTFCELLGGVRGPINPIKELALWLLGQRRHTLQALVLGVAEKVNRNTRQTDERLARMCRDLQDDLGVLLSDNAVLIYPSHPRPAPYHYQALVTFANFSYTGIFNILGLPVTQVPLGLSRDGLPVGVQVVGALHRDHVTLAVARELEKTFGGWVPPP
jgi:fatty acid amide hydrolase 2